MTHNGRETLASFWSRLRDAGVSQEHVDEMLLRFECERAEAIARAARLYVGNAEHEPISCADFEEMACGLSLRAHALALAIVGVEADNDLGIHGVAIRQLADDICRTAEQLAEALSAERALKVCAEGSSLAATSIRRTASVFPSSCDKLKNRCM